MKNPVLIISWCLKASSLGLLTLPVSAVPPPNDAFAMSRIIPSGIATQTVTGSTTAASLEANEPLPKTDGHGSIYVQGSIWWTHTPTTADLIVLDTVGSGVDTQLEIFTGAALNALTPIRLSDDAFPDGTSRVAWVPVAGTAYRVRVSGVGHNNQGPVTLNLRRRSLAADATTQLLYGRSYLEARTAEGLALADGHFSAALAASPTNKEANVLRSLSRLGRSQATPAFQTLLNHWGFTTKRATLLNPRYVPTRNARGQAVTPAGASTSQALSFANSSVLPELVAVEVGLSSFPPAAPPLLFTDSEAGRSRSSVDWGDVQVLRAITQVLKAAVHLANTHNTDIPLQDILDLRDAKSLNIENLLAKAPAAFLNRRTGDERAAAKAALKAANQTYQAGYAHLKDRVLTEGAPAPLFIHLPGKAAKRAESAQDAAEAAASLDGPASWDGVFLNLDALMTSTTPLRTLLPSFKGNRVIANSFPSPSLAGANPAGTQTALNTFLRNNRLLHDATPTPEISVEQGLTGNIPDVGGQDFGNVAVGGTTSLVFTIRNTGTGPLTSLATTINGADAAEFAVTNVPTAPVSGPSGSTTFTVKFAPTSGGAKAAVLQIANNDADENPFDIILTGTSPTPVPEIAVEQVATGNVPDGGNQPFGNVVVGSSTGLAFIIRNTGTGNLTGLATVIDGTNAADFSVTSNPTAPVNGQNSTTFTVQFSPTSTGAKTATLHIANNDADENPFDIILTGTGLNIIAQPNQIVNQGAPISFSVAVNGAASFQWSKDGVDIPGATGSSLVIASAQPWHIGNYTVRVTNAAGSTVSDPVSLRLTDVSSSIWRGLVACYPFDGSVEDLCRPGKPAGFVSTSGLVTDPQRGGVAHIQGKGWAIPAFTGEPAELQGPGGYLQIPRPPGEAGAPFTLSFVIEEEGFSYFHGESFVTMGEGASSIDLIGHYWIGGLSGPAEHYGRDFLPILPFASDYVLDGQAVALRIPWTTYTLVAEADQIRIYRNGQLLGSTPYKKDTAGDFFIGRHWWENGARFSTRLIAKVDDLRIYNRALSTQEVELLYSSAQFTVIPNSFEAWAECYGLSGGEADLSADPEPDGLTNREEYCFGTSPVTGSGPLVDAFVVGSTLKLRWFGRDGVLYSVKESFDLIPPWIGGLRVPSRAVDQSDVPVGYERMEVDIPLPPPTAPPDRKRFVKIEATIGPLIEDGGNVVTQPPSAETVAGQPASFAVAATGEGLTYQWYKDDQPIPGQTSAEYVIAAAQTSDVGNYSVVVTNAAGSATSRRVFFLVTE